MHDRGQVSSRSFFARTWEAQLMQEYVCCWVRIRPRLYTCTAIRLVAVYTFLADELHKFLVLSLPAWKGVTMLQARMSGRHPSSSFLLTTAETAW
jgi:hypothetical protein